MRKNNDKRRKMKILPKSTGLSAAMLIAILVQELFLFLLMGLDILPAKYAIILIVLLLLINLGVIKLINSTKKGTNQRLIGLIVIVAFVNIMLIGCSYLYNTLDTFSRISADGRQMEHYHVIVSTDSKYEEIEQIEGETVYVVKSSSKMYNEAEQRLLTKVDVTYKKEPDPATVSEHLTDKKNKKKDEIIFISRNNYEMLCEENKEFKKNTKIIYTVSVAVKSDDFAKRINVTEDPFNILISGVDTRGGIEDVCRSDVNMIVTVNPETREILLTSMPRDSYVKLHTYEMMDKLTHSGVYGVEETIMTIEDWLEIDINYYYRVNFVMLVDLVDAIGGVTVESPQAFKSAVSSYTYVKGENELTGKAALYFVRERKAFKKQDEARIANQQRVMKAILKKVTQSEVILTNYTDILDAVEGSMQTNMSNKDITSLVKMQLKDMSGWTIKTTSVDGDGASKGTYSMGPNRMLFVSVPKEESVKNVKQKIRNVMYPAQEETE